MKDIVFQVSLFVCAAVHTCPIYIYISDTQYIPGIYLNIFPENVRYKTKWNNPLPYIFIVHRGRGVRYFSHPNSE